MLVREVKSEMHKQMNFSSASNIIVLWKQIPYTGWMTPMWTKGYIVVKWENQKWLCIFRFLENWNNFNMPIICPCKINCMHFSLPELQNGVHPKAVHIPGTRCIMKYTSRVPNHKVPLWLFNKTIVWTGPSLWSKNRKPFLKQDNG